MESKDDGLEAERAWVEQRPWLKKLAMPTITVTVQWDDSSISLLRELLSSIHLLDAGDYENLEVAAGKLPKWFLDQSPKPLSKLEADRWLEKWSASSSSEQREMQSQLGWSAPDWLYWLIPENRLWYVIAASKESSSLVFASSELVELNGAADWMLRSCRIRYPDD